MVLHALQSINHKLHRIHLGELHFVFCHLLKHEADIFLRVAPRASKAYLEVLAILKDLLEVTIGLTFLCMNTSHSSITC